MSGRYVALAAAAGALCLTLAGCVGPGGSWQIPSFMRPLPAAAPTTHRYQPSAGGEINNSSPAAENETHAAKRRARRPPTRAVPAAVATPAPPPAPPTPKPTVTLADAPSKERAQRLLDQTGAKLAKVDRSSLGADSATTYDQAKNFLQAGRRAATENDYVAASGFAEKAAVLAAKLVPGSP
ncbi:MAG TPA: hypothetical protein VNF49_03285 [Candidatus Binataceae bacterium]|nr:hypothetical protein [Candidatus Binataceae bacterium]